MNQIHYLNEAPAIHIMRSKAPGAKPPRALHLPERYAAAMRRQQQRVAALSATQRLLPVAAANSNPSDHGRVVSSTKSHI